MNLKQLFSIIKDRQKNNPENSYVASLLKRGQARVAQKMGEEAVETVIAAQGDDKQRIIEELADLYFHALVLMASHQIELEDIYQELEKRHQNKQNID